MERWHVLDERGSLDEQWVHRNQATDGKDEEEKQAKSKSVILRRLPMQYGWLPCLFLSKNANSYHNLIELLYFL